MIATRRGRRPGARATDGWTDARRARRAPVANALLERDGIGTNAARSRDRFAATVGVPVGGRGLGTGRNGMASPSTGLRTRPER